MKYVKLGSLGLEVPAIGLGCMGMSEFYGSSSESQSLSVLDKALELGCTHWDTADIYGPFSNEELIAKALKGRRKDITLATKFGLERNTNGDWLGVNGHPDYVKKSCEASLRRLGTDYIDLYYQHRIDPSIPIEETVGAMRELVKEGKVRYLGVSEADPHQLALAHATHPISALQTEYSLWSRDVERDILPAARKLGIGFVAYSPLGRGFLSGKIVSETSLQKGDWRRSNPRFQAEAIEKNRDFVRAIRSIATRKDMTLSQVSLAWLLAQGEDIALIPGTKRIDYLELNWLSQSVTLDQFEIQYITDAVGNLKVEGNRY